MLLHKVKYISIRSPLMRFIMNEIESDLVRQTLQNGIVVAVDYKTNQQKNTKKLTLEIGRFESESKKKK